jgi:hypothetical protein
MKKDLKALLEELGSLLNRDQSAQISIYGDFGDLSIIEEEGDDNFLELDR